MSREPTGTCASCIEFKIHDAQNNAGRAMCAIFEREQHYADRACGPFYERDVKYLSTRRRIVQALNDSEK